MSQVHWSFGDDFARNVVIFDVDDSSLSHTDNCRNNFLVLVEGPTDDIIDSVGTAETNKNLVLTFLRKILNFLSVFITMVVQILLLSTKQRLGN